MSPEDIFASQIWPWPDPALKRDTMGRVLFVNAAFLQMYGGTIDDWRGNVVTGWPAPQAPGVPYRFETRLPTPEGEQVYDWMEFTMADGTAFAMARNVTYLFQTPDPQPGFEAQPPAAQAPVDAHQPASSAPAIPAATAQPVYAEAAPQITETAQAPAFENDPILTSDPIIEAAQSVQVPEIAPVSDVAVPEFEQALSEINEQPEMPVQTSQFEAAPQVETQQAPSAAPEPVQQDPVLEAPVSEVAAQEEPQQDERDFERRALPIENQDAVLGNNWRDAVIAKAVGADVTSDEDETPAEEEPAPSADAGDQIRILLAEDNAINALLTRTLLEAEGHAVDTVEDGALAVEAMKTSSYDLIFMDMRMPNMDGLEATRKIRAMSNVPKGLPIVALTANAFDDDRNACFDSGMNDFMTKPVSAEELSEMVRTWTKNRAERNVNAA